MRIECAILVCAVAASAQAAVINFDDLPSGVVVTNQYAALGAIFSSNQFNVSLGFVSGPTSTSVPNILCTSSTPDLSGLNCAERTTVDFVNPVNNLTFLVVEANSAGVNGRVSIYQGGAAPSAFVNILGVNNGAGGSGNHTLDLSAFTGITRIDLEGPTGAGSQLDANGGGIGWDDFSYDVVPAPSAAGLAMLAGMAGLRRRRQG